MCINMPRNLDFYEFNENKERNDLLSDLSGYNIPRPKLYVVDDSLVFIFFSVCNSMYYTKTRYDKNHITDDYDIKHFSNNMGKAKISVTDNEVVFTSISNEPSYVQMTFRGKKEKVVLNMVGKEHRGEYPLDFDLLYVNKCASDRN